MEHVLKKQKLFYNRLFENKVASKFLKERVKQVKKILKLDKDKTYTKLFSYPQNGYITVAKKKHNLFNCGISRYGLNFFNLYQSKTFNKFFIVNTQTNYSLNFLSN